MRPQLTVKVAPLRELFSGSIHFKLPWFQRAYAWQTSHVGRLLTDLFDGIQVPEGEQYYMLGSFMLAPTDVNKEAAVVDGNQRIVTMTILFAVLRDLEEDPERRAALHARIATEPEGSQDIKNRHLLHPQSSLVEFFDTLVQRPGATLTEPCESPFILAETERNIIENRDYLRNELSSDEVSTEVRRELAHFLEEACHVVVRIAQTESEAWQMLRVEEETRLDFHQADRAKASLIGVMPTQEREEAAQIWAECQNQLGSQDTYNLLSHVRAMKARKRSRAPLEASMCRLFSLDQSGLEFMQTIFKPNAQALAAIRTGTLSSSGSQEAGGQNPIMCSTELMSWINPDVWVPAALHWLESRGADDPYTDVFFGRLERLIWILKLVGIDPPRQETRIYRLLHQIDEHESPDDMSAIGIEKNLRAQAVMSLKRVSFRRKHIAAHILRRISVEIGNEVNMFNTDQAPTVEHILPLSPLEGSQWHRIFSNSQQRRNYVNRLGNLTFLTTPENQRAGNKEWKVKRPIFKKSKYALSTDAAKYEEWNAEAIDRRTLELVEILFKAWDLPLNN